MKLSSAELDLLYELVRLEANRLHREHGAEVLNFQPGSWAHRVITLDAKLTTDFHHRRNH